MLKWIYVHTWNRKNKVSIVSIDPPEFLKRSKVLQYKLWMYKNSIFAFEEQNELIASIVEQSTEAEKKQAAEKAEKDVAAMKKFEEGMKKFAEEAAEAMKEVAEALKAEIEAAGGPEAFAAKLKQQFEEACPLSCAAEALLEDISERQEEVCY